MRAALHDGRKNNEEASCKKKGKKEVLKRKVAKDDIPLRNFGRTLWRKL